MRDPVDPSWPEILFWCGWVLLSLVSKSGWLFLAGVAAFIIYTSVKSRQYESWKRKNAEEESRNKQS